MAIATPDTLAAAFGQIIAEAQKQAADQAQQLTDILATLGQLGDDIVDLPTSAFDDLEPNWWSLLVFVLLQIAKADEDHLNVGAMQPTGWSRMVTLTYTEALGPGQPSATLGLAVVNDAGADGIDLTRGV